MALLLHLLAILHGLGAAFGGFLVFQAFGAAVLPRRWRAVIAGGATPAIVGAAAFVLTCWFGVGAGIRLTPLALGFAAASALLSAFRFLAHGRVPALGPRGVAAAREFAIPLALFAGLYVLAYLFTLPPVAPGFLPLAWLGNVDLFQYLVYARHVQVLGPSPIADVSTHSTVYFQTPGAFHLLAGLSLFFGGDVLNAAMPVRFALMALVGLMSAHLVRRLFRLSALSAAIVAAAFLSGPFFRLLAGHYYLSMLMALPVLLNLLLVTLDDGEKRQRSDTWEWVSSLALTACFFAHYALLLLVYPYLFLFGGAFHVAAIALRAGASFQDGEPVRRVAREAFVLAGAAVAGVAALAASLPRHLWWAMQMVWTVRQTGHWGWPLDLVVPPALLGVPGVVGRVGGDLSSTSRSWWLAATWLAGLVLASSFVLPAWRRSTRPGERSALGLAALGFLSYAAYFTFVGPSYQQWKLASYTALPLSFTVLAVVLRAAAQHGHRAGVVAGAVVALVMVGGNAVLHGRGDPNFLTVKAQLRHLEEVPRELASREVFVQAPDVTHALLAAYFIPNLRLHVSTSDFHASEPVSFARVSTAQPLLLMGFACEGVGHDDVREIEGVGCLVFQPPSLVMERSYSFGRTFAFIEHSGLGQREAWGRASVRFPVQLRLTADRRRNRLENGQTWLNLLLARAGEGAAAPVSMRLRWGDGRRGEVLLGEPEWISLPLRVGDWAGDWVATLALTLGLADPAGLFTLQFRELSVTAQPRGRHVVPADGQ